MSKQKNEGEGNRTAANEYNKETRDFVKSGRVGEAASAAEKAMSGAEREELETARKEAATHAREHDPEEVRDYRKNR